MHKVLLNEYCFSIQGVPEVTALKYRGGLQIGVGTSTGHVSNSWR